MHASEISAGLLACADENRDHLYSIMMGWDILEWDTDFTDYLVPVNWEMPAELILMAYLYDNL